MPRRKRISDEEVLDGTLRVMFRAGPGEFTLAAAAAEAGIAPATLLQRFGDKQSLIVRAIARDNAGFERVLEVAPAARSREAVLDLFWLLTPDIDDPAALADQLLWLREDFRTPELNALAQRRFRLLRAAVAERLPPLSVSPETGARLLEAQWQGALNQWGFFHQGRLVDYVARCLTEWFDLAEAPAR
jgi:AcrR family transcriptional regulator